jgi:hypothetical protein
MPDRLPTASVFLIYVLPGPGLGVALPATLLRRARAPRQNVPLWCSAHLDHEDRADWSCWLDLTTGLLLLAATKRSTFVLVSSKVTQQENKDALSLSGKCLIN